LCVRYLRADDNCCQKQYADGVTHKTPLIVESSDRRFARQYRTLFKTKTVNSSPSSSVGVSVVMVLPAR
jgi:hypothetical protein